METSVVVRIIIDEFRSFMYGRIARRTSPYLPHYFASAKTIHFRITGNLGKIGCSTFVIGKEFLGSLGHHRTLSGAPQDAAGLPHGRPWLATLGLEPLNRELAHLTGNNEGRDTGRSHAPSGPEAILRTSTEYPDVETLVAVVGHSQIVFAASSGAGRLPAGFDDLDIAILNWVIAEGRRGRARVLRAVSRM